MPWSIGMNNEEAVVEARYMGQHVVNLVTLVLPEPILVGQRVDCLGWEHLESWKHFSLEALPELDQSCRNAAGLLHLGHHDLLVEVNIRWCDVELASPSLATRLLVTSVI